MEPSINSSYQQLPESVKKAIRLHTNTAISFNTNKAIIIRSVAVFLLAISILTLCIFLFNGELFQLVLLVLMLFGTVILFSHSNRIVIDPHESTILRQESWLWCSSKVLQQQDIKHTDVVITQAANKDGRRIEVLGQILQFEVASDGESLMAFLKQQFHANTLEQISSWPDKKPWFPASDDEMPLSADIVPLWSLRDKLKLLIPALVFSLIAAVLPWVRTL